VVSGVVASMFGAQVDGMGLIGGVLQHLCSMKGIDGACLRWESCLLGVLQECSGWFDFVHWMHYMCHYIFEVSARAAMYQYHRHEYLLSQYKGSISQWKAHFKYKATWDRVTLMVQSTKTGNSPLSLTYEVFVG
jgi:hypothetical protein